VVEYQIMQGYPDGSMRPAGNITRAEFAAMLARAMGNAQPDPTQTAQVAFTDVATSDWYYPDVQALLSAGVLPPGGQTFNPNEPITRYDAAVWLGRAVRDVFGVRGSGPAPDFPDVPSSTPNYADFSTAHRAGITHGYPDGTFGPAGAITRAEAAAMIYRFLTDLPGSGELELQTPYIAAMAAAPGTKYWGPPQYPPKGADYRWASPHPPTLMAADALGGSFVPASTQADFETEPDATWPQIHLWLATQNWLALGEAKLTKAEAQYVVSYPTLQA